MSSVKKVLLNVVLLARRSGISYVARLQLTVEIIINTRGRGKLTVAW